MVDGDVVGDPRPPKSLPEGHSRGPEDLGQDAPGRLQVVEAPPAVDDPDPESRPQERAIPATPARVLRKARIAELRRLVPPVVVDDEEATARPQDPFRLGQLHRLRAPIGGPAADDDVDALVGQPEPLRGALGHPDTGEERARRDSALKVGDRARSFERRHPRPEDRELAGDDATTRIDDDDVSPGDGSQGLKGPRQLRLGVEVAKEAGKGNGCQIEREISHGPPSIRGCGRRPNGRHRRPVAQFDFAMLRQLSAMPAGLRLFLAYAFGILALVGFSLRSVVDLAVNAPLSFEGLVVMSLLAYTIFTITLVLQRKEAGRGLALGLSSLTLPAVPILALGGFVVPALAVAVLAVALFYGLTRPAVRAYLNEP